MFGKGVKLARISGIDIWVDYSWLIIFGLVMWSLASGYFPEQYPGLGKTNYWIMGAVSAVLLFVCVLLHELSHSFVAQKSGIMVPRITLFIFGGVAQISDEARDPKTEFNIAVAGPICSFVLALIFWMLAKWNTGAGSSALLAMFDYLAFINIALAVFNLIPGFPLDGGRILRAYLWNRWKSVKQATRTVSRIGSGFGIVLILLGGLSFLTGTLVGGVWFIILGMFLYKAAKSGYRMTVLRSALSEEKVEEIMNEDVVSVPASATVRELVERYFKDHLHQGFPVVSDEGELIGMVTVERAKNIPRDSWDTKRVQDIMNSLSQKEILNPRDEALSAVNLFMRNNLQRAPVADGDRIVGIITRRDIMTLLSIKSDLEG